MKDELQSTMCPYCNKEQLEPKGIIKFLKERKKELNQTMDDLFYKYDFDKEDKRLMQSVFYQDWEGYCKKILEENKIKGGNINNE